VKLSYLDSNGDITGLDRFGRIVDQVWEDYSGTPTAIDRYTYTYDRAGNRLSKDNELNAALDEDYIYDDLDRLVEWKVNDVSQKTWDYDGQGNDLDSGTYNAANEMTPTVGSSGYDAAGNMTTLQSGDTAIYDAWNRMVEVNDGEDIIQQNEYDGTNRRIQIFSDFTGSTPGATQDDYYTNQQIIETHEDSAVKYQNIWSPRYIDSLILRDTLSSGSIVTADRIFYLSDANFNVTGLVKYNSGTSDWEVVERYTYTPYGIVTYRDADWDTYTGPNPQSLFSNPHLYTGRYLDLLTSLYYYRARFYDATLERFISRDPLGYFLPDAAKGAYNDEMNIPTSILDTNFTADKINDLNLYRYCGNKPLIHTDPSGKMVPAVLAGLAAVVAACGYPFHEYAHNHYGDSGDKFKHCWVSCQMSRACTGVLTQFAGLGKESIDVMRGLLNLEKYAGFGDSLDDLIANQQCVHWESYIPGINLFGYCRESCYDCCKREVGYKI